MTELQIISTKVREPSHIQVSEWRDRLGAPLAEEVRDLCVIAKTQNVTLLQCAKGFRLLNQLKNCGLKLDQIMPFILEFYNLCVSADKEPKEIFSICNEIFELQDPVPLAQLPEFISRLVERKRSLEFDISKVEIAIKGLQQEFSELFDKVSVTRFDLERYRKVEQELKKFDLTLQDLQKINTIIENVNSIGSDPKYITRELIEIKNCKHERSILEERVTHLKHEAMLAQRELRANELKLASCEELLGQYMEIKELKIGSEALKNLKRIVLTSAESNSLDPEVAFRRFSDDILTNYDKELGLEKKIAEKTMELTATQRMLDSKKLECSKYQKECEIVDRILSHNNNLQSADFVEIGEIIKAFSSEYTQILQELKDHRNLRNANSLLTAQYEKLVSENSKLSFENQTLRSELDLKSVNLRSLNERHKAIEQEFDRRSFQKVFEYENKIKEKSKAYLAAEARNIQNINTLKAKEKQQMSILNKINVPFELSPIIDAARGWQVDGESLKRATIISIELLYSRLNDDHNWEAKSKMLQALRSLKEEFIIF